MCLPIWWRRGLVHVRSCRRDELPPVFVPCNPLVRRALRSRPIATTPVGHRPDPAPDVTQVRRSSEEPPFNSLMEQYHYLVI
jgi:hypothetical protein